MFASVSPYVGPRSEWVNPLMLLVISLLAKAFFRAKKLIEGGMLIRTYPKTLVDVYCEFIPLALVTFRKKITPLENSLNVTAKTSYYL